MGDGRVQGSFESQVAAGLVLGCLDHSLRGLLGPVSAECLAKVVPVGKCSVWRRLNLLLRGFGVHRLLGSPFLLVSSASLLLLPLLALVLIANFSARFPAAQSGHHLLPTHCRMQAEDAFRMLHPSGLVAPTLRELPVRNDRLQHTSEHGVPLAVIFLRVEQLVDRLEVAPFVQAWVWFSDVPSSPPPDCSVDHSLDHDGGG